MQPESTRRGTRHMSVIHINSIVRGAHLLPRFPSDAPVYREINYMNILDLYTSFYVNKFIDHHVFKIAFWHIFLSLLLSSIYISWKKWGCSVKKKARISWEKQKSQNNFTAILLMHWCHFLLTILPSLAPWLTFFSLTLWAPFASSSSTYCQAIYHSSTSILVNMLQWSHCPSR